jgi:hypothetical protein
MDDQVLPTDKNDPEDAIPILDPDEIAEDEGLTSHELYLGYGETGEDPSGDDEVGLPTSADRLRAGETNDPYVAEEEGLAYIPPTDPPVIPGGDDAPVVASGSATTSMDEPFDEEHHQGQVPLEDEMTDRVREALRADASTSTLADRITIDTDGGVVTLRGVVEDLDDSDALVEVASRVDDVSEVRDLTRVEGL